MSQFLEHRQRHSDPHGTLTFLEIRTSQSAEVLRLVNDNGRDWISRGQLYTGLGFGFTLPEEASGQATRVSIVIATNGSNIAADLEDFQPGNRLTARLMVADCSAPDVYELDITLPVEQVTLTMSGAQAVAGDNMQMSQQAVLVRYDPFTCPGIF